MLIHTYDILHARSSSSKHQHTEHSAFSSAANTKWISFYYYFVGCLHTASYNFHSRVTFIIIILMMRKSCVWLYFVFLPSHCLLATSKTAFFTISKKTQKTRISCTTSRNWSNHSFPISLSLCIYSKQKKENTCCIVVSFVSGWVSVGAYCYFRSEFDVIFCSLVSVEMNKTGNLNEMSHLLWIFFCITFLFFPLK